MKIAVIVILTVILVGIGIYVYGYAGSIEEISQGPDIMDTVDEDTHRATATKENGKYIDYSESVLDERLAHGDKVVLFFHASWCPTCRAADSGIAGGARQIPDDVVVLKVDYDQEKGLKRKYGVLYQHTFVQLAFDRSAVTTFSGSRTVPAILSNLK